MHASDLKYTTKSMMAVRKTNNQTNKTTQNFMAMTPVIDANSFFYGINLST